MTAIIMGVGGIQLNWDDAFASSKFQFMIDTIPSGAIALYCISVGLLRGATLFLNGHLAAWGTSMRAATAFLSATVWGQMGASLYSIQITTGSPPSPSLPIFIVFVLAEFDAIHRAVADDRFR